MLQVKGWFIAKSFTEHQRAVLDTCYDYKIEKETEKAYYLRAETDYGNIKFWCPKSCTFEVDEDKRISTEEIVSKYNLSEEDTKIMWNQIFAFAKAEITEEQFKEALDKKNSGLEYNNRLVEFCKMAGIKVTKRRYTTSTLINMIENAGLEVPAR